MTVAMEAARSHISGWMEGSATCEPCNQGSLLRDRTEEPREGWRCDTGGETVERDISVSLGRDGSGDGASARHPHDSLAQLANTPCAHVGAFSDAEIQSRVRRLSWPSLDCGFLRPIVEPA